MERKVFTVTQINNYVKQLFVYDSLLNNLWIRGEISNLKKHGSGHFYFTLKDDNGAISAVMFRSHATNLKFEPEDGMSIITKGYISLYEKTGQYQFYATEMEPEGQGALFIAFEQLKAKLQKEGLFEQDIKKTIPKHPKSIGIVTSGTGAAIRDIVNVSQRRNSGVQLFLIPVLVQGKDAAESVREAIERFNNNHPVDVLIVGRGGGSIEDLWAFNEEVVARAIVASNIPVISAVGHETDFTIADFVSDLRAPTPSAAAELAVPSLLELAEGINNLQVRLVKGMEYQINQKREKLIYFSNHPAFRNPSNMIDQHKQYLDFLDKRLIQFMKASLDKKKLLLQAQTDQLSLLSPERNLERGYAMLFDENGNNLASINDVEKNQIINIKLKDGNVVALVKQKEE
ncbi:exodeoxyribonuclease VII large subunit [Vallitalea okinawensis]|uniref:exodeoxyribonuclease VII large subunit n=1 Tax=Vallitalea okinawensis TaxID=2078660 RepID=UPI000CFB9D65|nr:exodeoxyribonuclease VII large subunit [Vallitalea okinawensis]